MKVINSTELCNDDFYGCRVVVKKRLIEITNKINKERLFVIDGSEDNRTRLVKESISILMHECIDVLYKFIKVYGGNSNYVCVNYHVLDNKIVHDKVVDSIPLKTTFRNDVVKNVYKSNPSNIELSDPVFASNYFRNMGLNDYSPIIAEAILSIKPLRYLKKNIDCVDDVFKFKDYVYILSNVERDELSDWLIERFGVVLL